MKKNRKGRPYQAPKKSVVVKSIFLWCANDLERIFRNLNAIYASLDPGQRLRPWPEDTEDGFCWIRVDVEETR